MSEQRGSRRSGQLPLFGSDLIIEKAQAPEISPYLQALEAEGKYSPADWHRFSRYLTAQRKPGSPPAPPPMILAASGESPANKHRRLREQLDWAAENGCLDKAIQYLKRLPPSEWHCASPDKWNRDTYQFWDRIESQDDE